MGNFGDGDNSKKGKSRGGTAAASRLAGLGKQSQATGSADWSAAESGMLARIIVEVTCRGGLVSFGMSRDQGAHMITILMDNDKRTLWISGSDDLDLELEKIVALLEIMSR